LNSGEKVEKRVVANLLAKAVSKAIFCQIGATSSLSDSARPDEDFRCPPTAQEPALTTGRIFL
jgi:hypothetical protein